jgi:hypothetical protein
MFAPARSTPHPGYRERLEAAGNRRGVQQDERSSHPSDGSDGRKAALRERCVRVEAALFILTTLQWIYSRRTACGRKKIVIPGGGNKSRRQVLVNPEATHGRKSSPS